MNKLIIFIKNPVLGRVKTRLAATIGDEKALDIYLNLIDYTLSLTNELEVEVNLFFSDNLDNRYTSHKKKIQRGNDLGERMKNAFDECFSEEGERIIIIGTDCAELTTKILKEAFDQLQNTDLVIGPAKDGGYYLLGMNQFYPDIFNEIQWSTSSVFEKTILKAKNNKLTVTLLPILTDIDTEEDLITLKNKP